MSRQIFNYKIFLAFIIVQNRFQYVPLDRIFQSKYNQNWTGNWTSLQRLNCIFSTVQRVDDEFQSLIVGQLEFVVPDWN